MKRILHSFLALFSLTMAHTSSAQQETKPAPAESKDGVKHVDAAGALKLLQAAAAGDKAAAPVIIDVRTADEFKAGHLKGAVNIDFLDASFAEKVAKLDPKKTYLVHCQAGGRSTKSLDGFKAAGIKSLIHMDGGYGAWEKAGNPVTK